MNYYASQLRKRKGPFICLKGPFSWVNITNLEEGKTMKKLLSILFSTTLILTLGSPAFADEDKNVAKALDLIEKTNRDIDQKIEKAVEKADSLQTDYIADIRKIEEGDKLIKLKNEREKALSDLEAVKNDRSKEEKLQEKVFMLNAKINEEQLRVDSKLYEIHQDIDEATAQLVPANDKDAIKLEEKISKLTNKLDERSEKYQEKTERFTSDLQKVIKDVYNETLQLSANTIKKAAENGVIAECSWKLVRFADKWVYIDPIRIVKF